MVSVDITRGEGHCQIEHFFLHSVFWGGREGYQTLLNTDVKRELDHMAAFFRMAVGEQVKGRVNGVTVMSREVY